MIVVVKYVSIGTLSTNRLGGTYVLGIDAITANNGWAMALTGACIVMTGLSILSFVISQLHKIVALTEGKGKKHAISTPEPAPPEVVAELAAEIDLLDDLPAAARIYSSLTTDLGEAFPLAALHRIAQKENLPHPHITIMALRGAAFLAPVGEGNFTWKNI
jgi:hypothetical protein